MADLVTFAAALLVAGLCGLGAALAIHLPLRRVLAIICGVQAAGDFWMSFTMLSLVVGPMVPVAWAFLLVGPGLDVATVAATTVAFSLLGVLIVLVVLARTIWRAVDRDMENITQRVAKAEREERAAARNAPLVARAAG